MVNIRMRPINTHAGIHHNAIFTLAVASCSLNILSRLRSECDLLFKWAELLIGFYISYPNSHRKTI